MSRTFQYVTLAGVLALSAGVACDREVTASGDTTLRLLLTDAAAAYIDAAYVDIGEVLLLSADEDVGPILLTEDGTDGFIDLLELQDAATTTLAEADIEAGTYTQLRLIVEGARVVLADGYTFTDGSTEKPLFVPSGAQTGIKLNLGAADGEKDGPGLEIRPGEMVLVLDFDVNQSYVIQGNPRTPAGIKGVLFRPTLRVTAEDQAATISGTVSGDAIAGLEVSATPPEDAAEEFQTGTATATTADDGSFTLHFLVPGTYVVTVAAPDGYVSDPASHTVTVGAGEDASGVDFTVLAETT